MDALTSQRTRVVVPFPVERAQRRDDRANCISLLDLEQELDERRRTSIHRGNGRSAGPASFTELMNRAGPRALGLLLAGAVISVAALETCQGVR